MAILLDYLLEDNEKIVTVIGLRGIGKSSLVRNTLHYVSERKLFSRGIFLIQLKDSRTCLALFKLIMRAILSAIDFDKGDREAQRNFEEQHCTRSSMIAYFISFFNNKQEEKLKKSSKLSGEQHLFLLCLDNAEKILENDREEFLDFLEELYDSCPDIRVIITSDCAIG